MSNIVPRCYLSVLIFLQRQPERRRPLKLRQPQKPLQNIMISWKVCIDVKYSQFLSSVFSNSCPIVSSNAFKFPAEEMIRGLQSLGWKKVDVSFHSAFWPFLAHNNIHVQIESLKHSRRPLCILFLFLD